jgi:hypothetical protein
VWTARANSLGSAESSGETLRGMVYLGVALARLGACFPYQTDWPLLPYLSRPPDGGARPACGYSGNLIGSAADAGEFVWLRSPWLEGKTRSYVRYV